MKSEIEIIFSKIPTILTERLILRRIKVKDIPDIYEYSKNTQTSKYLLWYPHASIKFTKAYFKIIDRKYKKGKFYNWGIIDSASGKMIGTCGFTRINTVDNKAEVGYVINPHYWGRGIASEALKRVIEFGFDFLNLERIESRYIKENTASRRVMEKCHMSFEGIMRHLIYAKGEYFDVGVCAITQDEYRKLQKTESY